MKRIIAVTIFLAITAFWITSPLFAIDQVSSGGSKVSGSLRAKKGWIGFMDLGSCPPWETVQVPSKLPVPKNTEWLKRLKIAWISELNALAQFEADQEKFNAFMPYLIVLPQTAQHIRWIENLFEAYGLKLNEEFYLIGPMDSLKEAYEKGNAQETKLIPEFEWLVKNAEDRDSAFIIDIILLRSRFHSIMFEHILHMGQVYAFGIRNLSGLDYGYSFGKGINVLAFGNGHLPPKGKLMSTQEAESQVKDYLKSSRNPNLKLRKIRDMGKFIEVEIVTKNDSLVDKIRVDKSTGWMKSAY